MKSLLIQKYFSTYAIKYVKETQTKVAFFGQIALSSQERSTGQQETMTLLLFNLKISLSF